MTEEVVLCAESGAAIGTAPKATVHTTNTPLHLAFSCYVFTADGQVLVTRRAATKLSWPGVRTNSCCGHPGPGEAMAAAVARRLDFELGITPVATELILPRFRYLARMTSGLTENELCPVYRVLVDSTATRPNPAEVDEAWWQPWSEFVDCAPAADPLSPWALDQLAELRVLGPEPLHWPTGADRQLPAAART